MTKTVKKKLNNPRSGENSRMIRLVLHSLTLPEIDITDPKQVQERISLYFDFCERNNWFPCIAGLATWLGVCRDTINSWKNGLSRKETHQAIIQRAYDVIETVLVDQLMNNAIYPAAGIFLLKSMFGYRDRFDLSLEAAANQRPSPFDSLPDPELARKYLLEAIPDEEPEGKEGESNDLLQH